MGVFTKNFGQIKYGLDVPHLLKLQLDSYYNLLQEDADP